MGSPGDRDGLPPRRPHRVPGRPGRQPQQPESGDGPEWLGDLLRFEAARHEPNRGRILALMAERERDEYQVPATVSSLDVQRRDRARREGHDRDWFRGRRGRGDRVVDPGRQPASGGGRVAWPLVAASVAVLTMATVAGARVLAPGENAGVTVTPEATPTISRSLVPPVSITPTPASTSGPPTPAIPTGTLSWSSPGGTTPTTGATPTRGGQAPQGVTGDAVSILVRPTGHGTELAVPRDSSDRDWIAVGSRTDGRLVRAKNPSRPLGAISVSGYGASIVHGPYRVSWSGGGTPEQSRDVDTTWQSITAVDGRIRITVPLRGDRFTVDLFAGTVKTTGQVRVSLDGSPGGVSAVLPMCRRDVCADVVSITVDSAHLPGGGMSGDLVIDLGPARPGDGLGLGLAAVVLR